MFFDNASKMVQVLRPMLESVPGNVQGTYVFVSDEDTMEVMECHQVVRDVGKVERRSREDLAAHVVSGMGRLELRKRVGIEGAFRRAVKQYLS